MSRLNRLYKASRALFDSDEEFKDAGPRPGRRPPGRRRRDAGPLAASSWTSRRSTSTPSSRSWTWRSATRDIVGESRATTTCSSETCRLLEESGVAVRSEGALCVFFDDVKGPDGNPIPLIVQKSNGGFGYAATDLSAIRDRVGDLKADTLLYVVDARQALHFKMVFETARRAGWLTDEVAAVQLAFGTVLGKDGKPFKTREGETVRLVDLLDEAIERAAGGRPGEGAGPARRTRSLERGRARRHRRREVRGPVDVA